MKLGMREGVGLIYTRLPPLIWSRKESSAATVHESEDDENKE